MTMSGLAVFDHTLQETNTWLKDVATRLHFEDRHHAYSALRAVLHALRDQLPAENAVHLSAQLPMLVRGLFFEGWHMTGTPIGDHRVDEFVNRVAAKLPPKFPIDALQVTKAVLAVVQDRIAPGEAAKLVAHLPGHIRELWPPSPQG